MIIPYLLSSLIGLFIFLCLMTVAWLDDHKAKIHQRMIFFRAERPISIDWREKIWKLLDLIKVPGEIHRLVNKQNVIWSGIKMTHHQFVSAWWLVILIGISLVLIVIGFGMGGPLGIVLLIGLVLTLSFGPDIYLRYQVRARLKDLDRSLPELLDMLTLVIEAGLGFVPALKRIEGWFTGVLGVEIRRALIRMEIGFSSREALRESIDRVPSSNLNHFVEAILLSERLGTSLAKTIRVQANLLRNRRRQQAEYQARTAPIRIIPALVFFFLPSLLLIYLAPPILNFLLRR